MKGLAMLIVLAAAGATQAQTVYRCGNAFSNVPCAAQAVAAESRPMMGDNETVQEFALRQARILEERRTHGAPRVAAPPPRVVVADARGR